jgi:transposase
VIRFSDDIQIWIGVKPVDMRCAIDGLLIQVSSQLKLNPQARQLFLFYSKGKDKVKGLWWDKNGFILIYKRLECGRFKLPRNLSGDKLELTLKQCYWLLAGLDFITLTAQEEILFQYYN